jgi:hypothetical protein
MVVCLAAVKVNSIVFRRLASRPFQAFQLSKADLPLTLACGSFPIPKGNRSTEDPA